MTDVVAVYELTQEILDRLAAQDGAPDELPALGFYWTRLRRVDDANEPVDQRGPFPVFTEAWHDAVTDPGNAGQDVQDWRVRPPEDVAPVASTETVVSEAHVVEAGPDEGVVPLHDVDGSVLPGHEGETGNDESPPSARQEWPFDAQVREHPGTGEPMTGTEIPAGMVGALGEDYSVAVPFGTAVDDKGELRWVEENESLGSLVEDEDGAPLPNVRDEGFQEAAFKLNAFLDRQGLGEDDDAEADAAAEAERAGAAADAEQAAHAEAVARNVGDQARADEAAHGQEG